MDSKITGVCKNDLVLYFNLLQLDLTQNCEKTTFNKRYFKNFTQRFFVNFELNQWILEIWFALIFAKFFSIVIAVPNAAFVFKWATNKDSSLVFLLDVESVNIFNLKFLIIWLFYVHFCKLFDIHDRICLDLLTDSVSFLFYIIFITLYFRLIIVFSKSLIEEFLFNFFQIFGNFGNLALLAADLCAHYIANWIKIFCKLILAKILHILYD